MEDKKFEYYQFVRDELESRNFTKKDVLEFAEMLEEDAKFYFPDKLKEEVVE